MRRLGRGEFVKYHALGNDYLVVDSATFGSRLTAPRVRRICDRHEGVGSDGILVLSKKRGEFHLRIRNPDGSEAEKSGNGLRIVARFLVDHGYTRRREFSIVTPGGRVTAQLVGPEVRVEMGRASFRSRDIPVTGRPREVVHELLRVGGRALRMTCVSVGNPHCVVFVPRLDREELRQLGPLLENHRSFPNRINVQLARVRSRRRIDLLVWERGAGETRASGSSACAVAAAAVRRGLADGDLRLRMPGGELHIEVDAKFQLRLTGPATPIYRGRLL